MQLLEYQAKELLRGAGLKTPDSVVAESLSDVDIDKLQFPVVIKSQVPIGGRGKLGGVKLIKNVDDFSTTFQEIKTLDIKGYVPEKLLIEQALDIDRELYLALRVNRDARRIDVIASGDGGIEIESHSSSIVSLPYDDDLTAVDVAKTLDIDESTCKVLLEALYTCMINNDLLLLEINPLVVTKTDELVAADAKCLLDDSALFRHPAYASKAVSSSVMPLGGTIGVIANGAGMAMSTMDTIYAAGGRPANFLDIGGGTGEDVFIKNLREITQLSGVTSIIINIFAGITRCDDIARGIIAAQQQISDLVPLYIRLEGTNRDEAVKLLENARIGILPDLKTCVRRALEATVAESRKYEVESSPAADEARVADGRAVPTFDKIADFSKEGTDHLTGPVSSDLRGNSEGISNDGNGNAEPLFNNSPGLVQGITGHHGSFHTKAMLDTGTNIVAGVTPGKAGQDVHGVPVYNTVKDACKTHHATTSVIFVPAKFARTAMIEALDADITLIICITEGIPVHDMLVVKQYADDKNATILGPNCPGLIIPGSHKLGIIASHITTAGTTAIISRSGTLTYELADALTKKGIGQRIVLGIGGDPVQGMNFTEALEICEKDSTIDRMIMIGEIGGTSEQLAANFIKDHVSKPVYGLVVGHSLPAGQQFGHAGAIVGGLGESAQEKTDHMRTNGIIMSTTLDELTASISQR